jgi:hypothetical protein
MSADDYAILVGINDYPRLGEGNTPATLKGPANDVEAVRAWLTDPNGGGIADPSHIVATICPTPNPADDARPSADALEQAIIDMHTLAQRSNMRIGRRLYIFMSGHGFSPGRQRACLLAANAQENAMRNVHATGWLNWLQDSGYFREYVLWMDCCMNRLSFLPARDPPLQPVNARDPPRAGFVAFAAQRPLRAVERPFVQDGNKTHGVFTWALLKGLRGAAADANGRVTGRSLADWLRNALFAYMADEHRQDGDVAKEPEVVQEDAGLIFARGVGKPTSRVTLRFPTLANNVKARIWSGQPPVPREERVNAGAIEVELTPGLYVVDVPGHKLRQGFEVLDDSTVEVKEEGKEVVPPAENAMLDLEVETGDPNAEIFVIDSRFSLADSGAARLSAKLPFGIFKVKTRVGRGVQHRVILLDEGRPPIDPRTVASLPATVPPLGGTAATHEAHIGAARDAVEDIRKLKIQGNRSALLVMARTWTGKQARDVGSRPWEGVRVVDAAGRTIADLAESGSRVSDGDPFATYTCPIEPGTYFLRQELPPAVAPEGPPGKEVVIEQSLVASPGWALEVYILRRAGSQQQEADIRPRVSVMLRSLGGHPECSDEEYRVIEVARTALADERQVLNTDLANLLFDKIPNPMARLVGGHLLLVERERDPTRDISALDGIVRRLQSELGKQHPDVVALSLMCPDTSLRTTRPITAPPMFQRSWNILIEAAQRRSTLVPEAVWARAHALAALPPFLIWTIDESIKAEHRRDLARSILGDAAGTVEEEAISEPVAMAQAMLDPGSKARPASRNSMKFARQRAARLQVPASALASLLAEDPRAEQAAPERPFLVARA